MEIFNNLHVQGTWLLYLRIFQIFIIDIGIHDFFSGTYVPLTEEGTVIVNGILASYYATFDHDLVHYVMTPFYWFPKTIKGIFGETNDILDYVEILKSVGRYMLPYVQLYEE